MANVNRAWEELEKRGRAHYPGDLVGLQGAKFNNGLRRRMARDVADMGLRAGSPVVVHADGRESILTATPRGFHASVLDVRSGLPRNEQVGLLDVLIWTRAAADAGTLSAARPDLVARWRGETVQTPPTKLIQAQFGLVLAVDGRSVPRPYHPVHIAASLPDVRAVGLRTRRGNTRWLEPVEQALFRRGVRVIHVHTVVSDFPSAAKVARSLDEQGLRPRDVVRDLGLPSRGTVLSAAELQQLRETYQRPVRRPSGAAASRARLR